MYSGCCKSRSSASPKRILASIFRTTRLSFRAKSRHLYLLSFKLRDSSISVGMAECPSQLALPLGAPDLCRSRSLVRQVLLPVSNREMPPLGAQSPEASISHREL